MSQWSLHFMSVDFFVLGLRWMLKWFENTSSTQILIPSTQIYFPLPYTRTRHTSWTQPGREGTFPLSSDVKCTCYHLLFITTLLCCYLCSGRSSAVFISSAHTCEPELWTKSTYCFCSWSLKFIQFKHKNGVKACIHPCNEHYRFKFCSISPSLPSFFP